MDATARGESLGEGCLGEWEVSIWPSRPRGSNLRKK